MDVVERSLRLLETQQAGLGVLLAVVPVVAAVLIGLLRRPEQLFRGRAWILSRVVLILAAGVVVGAGIVHVSYEAWYRHRCVYHHSDIPECDTSEDGGELSGHRGLEASRMLTVSSS